MSKVKIKAGTTSYSVEIFVADSSSSIGAGLSTLTSATSGLTVEYRRRGASSWTAITLVGSGGGKTLGTWTSGGFLSDGQGMYELDLPNAVLATGATGAYVRLYGATNMLLTVLEIELDAVDYQSATDFGLSRLDAAITSRMASFTLPTNFSSLSITGGGAVTAGTVSDKTGYSLSQSFPTNFSSLAITGGGAVTAGTVSDKTGYSLTTAPPTTAEIKTALEVTGGMLELTKTRTLLALPEYAPGNNSGIARKSDASGGGAGAPVLYTAPLSVVVEAGASDEQFLSLRRSHIGPVRVNLVDADKVPIPTTGATLSAKIYSPGGTELLTGLDVTELLGDEGQVSVQVDMTDAALANYTSVNLAVIRTNGATDVTTATLAIRILG